MNQESPSPCLTQVKAVLGQLEKTLLELSSFGQQLNATSPGPSSGAAVFRGSSGNPRVGTATTGGDGPSGGAEMMTGAATIPAVTPGGIFGEAALPAWQQLLDRVKKLSRCASVCFFVFVRVHAHVETPRPGAATAALCRRN